MYVKCIIGCSCDWPSKVWYVLVLQEDPSLQKYKKLNTALVDIIEEYSLVSFVPLNVQVYPCIGFEKHKF